MDIRLVIYSHKLIYDDVVVSIEGIKNRDKKDHETKKKIIVPLNDRGVSGYTAYNYIKLMRDSHFYRHTIMESLHKLISLKTNKGEVCVLLMKLEMPKKEFLDYKWGERTSMMLAERREIEYAMSWLSTFGGAFSAMGDQFHHCAEIAGKISVQQFKLAMRLGEPRLLARCQLYACLSLIQQERYKVPRRLIPNIFQYAITSEDIHLQNMCKGIWAKFKYCYGRRNKRQIKKS